MRAEVWASIATVATFFVIAYTAWIARRSLQEADRLRREQARPYLWVGFESRSYAIYIAIENLGRSVARDVRLEVRPNLRAAVAHSDAVGDFLPDGIPALPPRKKLRYFFDGYIERSELNRSRQSDPYESRYDVTVTYRGDAQDEPFKEEFVLDLVHMEGLDISQETISDRLGQIVKEMKTANAKKPGH